MFALVLLASFPLFSRVDAAGMVKQHVKHVLCPVCETAAGKLWDKAQTISAEKSIAEREEQIVEYSETLCEPKEPNGKWLASADVVLDAESGKVSLVMQVSPGWCGSECLTMARACEDLSDHFNDWTDSLLSDKALTRVKYANTMCRTVSGACKGLKKQREAAKLAGVAQGKVPGLGAEPFRTSPPAGEPTPDPMAGMAGMPGGGFDPSTMEL
eukprot:g60138.t1